jgi:hypothetical protein
MIDQTDAHRLAAMAHALRADWPLRSLVTFIERDLAARAFRDIAVALAYVACEPNSATPKRLLEAGPWWRAASAPSDQTWRPPRKDECCPVHLGSWAGNCSGCAADRAAGDETTPGDPRRPDRTERIAELRRIQGETRAHLCRHGLDRGKVRCRACDLTAKPTTETVEA